MDLDEGTKVQCVCVKAQWLESSLCMSHGRSLDQAWVTGDNWPEMKAR